MLFNVHATPLLMCFKMPLFTAALGIGYAHCCTRYRVCSLLH